MSTLGRRVINWTKARPAVHNMVRPAVNKYIDLVGYRKIGLVYDDIIAEENGIVQKALERLPPRLTYDRMFRHRRAMQLSLSHSILPPEEQTKPEEDIPYLQPYIEEIEREISERKELDAASISK